MKLSKFLLGVALCTASSILWVSCKKNDSFLNPIANESRQHLGGAVKDDPTLVAKVHVLISDEFLAASKDALLHGQVNTDVSGQGRGGGDHTKPTVIIASPLTNSTVSGTVSIQVRASDNVGVSLVSLSIDGILLASSSISPYNFSWITSGVASGTHTITATAKDAAGNSSSASIQVGINIAPSGDVTAPVVSITSPVSGSAISSGATVSISVSASDNVGVSSVTFSVDGTVQTTAITAPYSFSWNTTGVASGTHTLTATAKDAAGNTSLSSILVTLNSTVLPPPSTLPSAYQLALPPAADQGSEGSCVSFAVGYAARSAEKYYRTGASNYSLSTNIMSPEYLFNQTRSDSYCSGSSLITALEFLKSNGICTWQTMPYSSLNGCSLMPTATQTNEAASNRILDYSIMYTADITGIKTMLASNRPLLVDFMVDSYFSNATPGFIWQSFSSTFYARHAVAICGYDDAKHAVKVMSSWGPGWGESGFSWIDYDFLGTINANVFAMNF